REWLPYPPLRHVRGRGNMLEGWIIRSAVVSIPESELTVQFGCYKVTDWYKADVLKSLASRIANWQAEALVPRAGTVPTSKPAERTDTGSTGATLEQGAREGSGDGADAYRAALWQTVADDRRRKEHLSESREDAAGGDNTGVLPTSVLSESSKLPGMTEPKWRNRLEEFESLLPGEFSLIWSSRRPASLDGQLLPTQWSWWRFPDECLRVRLSDI